MLFSGSDIIAFLYSGSDVTNMADTGTSSETLSTTEGLM